MIRVDNDHEKGCERPSLIRHIRNTPLPLVDFRLISMQAERKMRPTSSNWRFLKYARCVAHLIASISDSVRNRRIAFSLSLSLSPSRQLADRISRAWAQDMHIHCLDIGLVVSARTSCSQERRLFHRTKRAECAKDTPGILCRVGESFRDGTFASVDNRK